MDSVVVVARALYSVSVDNLAMAHVFVATLDRNCAK